jgi:hypothetical protein
VEIFTAQGAPPVLSLTLGGVVANGYRRQVATGINNFSFENCAFYGLDTEPEPEP